MPSDYTEVSRVKNKRTTQYSTWLYDPISGSWNPSLVNVNNVTMNDWESLYSRRNGWPYSRRTGKDVGGNFKKVTFTDQHDSRKFDVIAGNRRASGELLANGNSPTPLSGASYVSTLAISDRDAIVDGTRYIAQLSPTAPQANLTTSLVELKREGLPALSSNAISQIVKYGTHKGKKTSSGNAVGGDYLNWQFGIMPIISDVQALAKSVMDTEILLKQLYRDNGKMVRRGSKPRERVISETSREVSSYGYPALNSSAYYPKGAGKLFESTKVSRTQWFSGAFMYHLPESTDAIGRVASVANDARYLYGLSFSPIDFWNLVPWSWLLDWCFNVGSMLSTLSDQLYNRQVLKYGYVMTHTKSVITSQVTVNITGSIYTPSTVRTYDVKQRIAATPFGFGLDWDGFSLYQLSILGALGLARGR